MYTIRELKHKDAEYMLEWMHDTDVCGYMDKDFSRYTRNDCISFINESHNKTDEIHRAIVDDEDEYMGTVSLKNIDLENAKAEFAITIRKKAMGKGIGRLAMEEALRYGFDKGLCEIYWYVSPDNTRALRFYDKNGYKRVELSEIRGGQGQQKYIWYLEKRGASQ